MNRRAQLVPLTRTAIAALRERAYAEERYPPRLAAELVERALAAGLPAPIADDEPRPVLTRSTKAATR